MEACLARRLELVAGALAMAVVCLVAVEEDISWIPWAFSSLVVFLLMLTQWPYGALTVLIVASAMPRIAVGVFGWNARPEHFAAAILLPLIGAWLAGRKQRTQLDRLDYWVLAYIVINYISSAFGSSDPRSTLRWALQNNLAVLPYFLIRVIAFDLSRLRKAFQILLSVGLAEASYGLLCYASHHLFGTKAGMEVGQYLVDVSASYGTMYEPNLFGAYTACFAALFLALYLTGDRHKFGYLGGFLVSSVAAVSSYSRAALFALILSVGWVFWKTRHIRRESSNRFVVFGLGLGLVMIIALTSAGAVLQERIGDLYYQGLTEGTAISRVIVIQEAIQDVPKHPLFGSGTASFNLSFDWARYIPEWTSDKTWIGNAPLRILHDTGLVGLTAFLGFLISLWVKVRRCLRTANGPAPMLMGLSAGALVYCVSFQSTDGTILAFFWVYLGFLASAAILGTDPGLK